MIEKFHPLFDRVLVARDAQEEVTDSGIILSEISQDKKQTGKVIAVGTGKVLTSGITLPMQVNIGDTVYFGKYAGVEMDHDHVLLKEEEILGIIWK